MSDDLSRSTMIQTAPYPFELDKIVKALKYRPGWLFKLREFERDPGSKGLTFVVTSLGYNSYAPQLGETYRVLHYFPVPPATYNRQSWLEWVRDRLLDIEAHECCEFMRLEFDGEFVKPDGSLTDTYVDRPFAPVHAPGWNPYAVRSVSRTKDAETDFRGVRHEGSQRRLDITDGPLGKP